jgi:hypothetical protein
MYVTSVTGTSIQVLWFWLPSFVFGNAKAKTKQKTRQPRHFK